MATEVARAATSNTSVIYGWGNDRMISCRGRIRLPRELHVKDRDWAPAAVREKSGRRLVVDRNPGTFYQPAIREQSAAPDGDGHVNQRLLRGGADPRMRGRSAGRSSRGTCRFQFTFFDNLAEKTNTYKMLHRVQLRRQRYVEIPRRSAVLVPRYAELAIRLPAYPPHSLFGPDRLHRAEPSRPDRFESCRTPAVHHAAGMSRGDAQACVLAISRYLGVTGLRWQAANRCVERRHVPAWRTV